MDDSVLRKLVDDSAIDGVVPLLRQINAEPAPRMVDWNELDDRGCPRIRSSAFQRASKVYAAKYNYPVQTVSFYLETVVVAEYGSVGEWMQAVRPGSMWGVARVPAGLVRRAGDFGLMRDDLGGFLGHTVAWALGSSNKAKGAQAPIAHAAEWVHPPARP